MDDPGTTGNLTLQLLLLLVLIIINAVFATAEVALVSLNDNKIKKMAENGNKKALKLTKLTGNSTKFMSMVQIVCSFLKTLIAVSASQILVYRWTAWIDKTINYSIPGLYKGIAIVAVTIVISFFSLLLGELVPRRIAMQSSEKIAFRVTNTVTFMSKVSTPIIWLMNICTKIVVRILGFDPNDSEELVTEEEIRMMVDVGKEKGVIEESQKEMINNIFEFDDTNARDIMTHRTDISALSIDKPLEEAIKLGVEEGYSRIPVFKDDLDDIAGILYVKDLLPYVFQDIPSVVTIESLMRKAYFVPETKKCVELFTELTEKHVQMAVVVDEYGGTAGLVTLEDIIEFLVGSNIQDEYDNEEEEVSQINDSTFTIDGTTDIEEVSEILNTEFPEGDYDTLGGFLIEQLGYLPKNGDNIVQTYKNLTFTVLSIEDKRIGKVKVEIA